MKRLPSITSTIIALSAVVVLATGRSAQAEVSDLHIRFAEGCVQENVSEGCSIQVSASGFTFNSNDRVVLYASSGPNAPLHRVSNHWRYLSSRGRTVATIRNIPGACFQVRTWTAADDAATFYNTTDQRLNPLRSARRTDRSIAYGDIYRVNDRGTAINRAGSSSHLTNHISSNIICESLGR